jgi:uncharacterized protein DUF6953
MAEKFGSQFTCDNQNGDLAIRIDVLTAFRKLTKDSVVWVREGSYWRMRDPRDGPGQTAELGVFLPIRRQIFVRSPSVAQP